MHFLEKYDLMVKIYLKHKYVRNTKLYETKQQDAQKEIQKNPNYSANPKNSLFTKLTKNEP
ncbi:TPA: hypothetical protein DEG21_05450 [Patescibacteria group bacterium]|nr:hypothetical protein [Candidatus Gracilibacteria bacterium]